eukprot:COSAG05_NODE_10_length_39559_cov_64.255423_24_plen_50_part_00
MMMTLTLAKMTMVQIKPMMVWLTSNVVRMRPMACSLLQWFALKASGPES